MLRFSRGRSKENKMSIKITTLGSTGTGKTCYLYAMANQMPLSSNGFTFGMEYGTDQFLALNGGWENIEKGVWPCGTMTSDTYSFSCSYASRPIADSELYDYKGGILTTRGDECDADRRTDLIGRMYDSIALIICISAYDLKSLSDDYIDIDLQQIFYAYRRLLQNSSDTQGKTIPVIFAITKSDLITKKDFENGINSLRNHVFAPLFVNGGGWFVGFVPVSIGQIDKGVICPRNVEIPILFGVKNYLESVFNGTTLVKDALASIDRAFVKSDVTLYSNGIQCL